MAISPVLLLLEAAIILGVGLYLLHVAYQSTVLRRVSILVGAGYFVTVVLSFGAWASEELGYIGTATAHMMLLLLVFLGSLLFLWAGMENTRDVVFGLNSLQATLDGISHGDMDADIDSSLVNREDELGGLARSFDRLLTSFKMAAGEEAQELVEKTEKVQHALREEEERFRDIFESLAIPYYMVDLEGRFKMVNEEGAELLGYDPQELEGLHFSEIASEEGQDAVEKAIEEASKGESLDRVELETQRKEGDTVVGTFKIFPVFRGEEIIGVHGIVIDAKEESS